MILPEFPGSPSYLRSGTPALAVFLHDLDYSTGELARTIWAIHRALPTAHGFQEYWGYFTTSMPCSR